MQIGCDRSRAVIVRGLGGGWGDASLVLLGCARAPAVYSHSPPSPKSHGCPVSRGEEGRVGLHPSRLADASLPYSILEDGSGEDRVSLHPDLWERDGEARK